MVPAGRFEGGWELGSKQLTALPAWREKPYAAGALPERLPMHECAALTDGSQLPQHLPMHVQMPAAEAPESLCLLLGSLASMLAPRLRQFRMLEAVTRCSMPCLGQIAAHRSAETAGPAQVAQGPGAAGARGRQSAGHASSKLSHAKLSWAALRPHVLRRSHKDQVLQLPEGGEVLAKSALTPIEVWGIGDQVLGLQGHPEFTPAFMKVRCLLELLGPLRCADVSHSLLASMSLLQGCSLHVLRAPWQPMLTAALMDCGKSHLWRSAWSQLHHVSALQPPDMHVLHCCCNSNHGPCWMC